MSQCPSTLLLLHKGTSLFLCLLLGDFCTQHSQWQAEQQKYIQNLSHLLLFKLFFYDIALTLFVLGELDITIYIDINLDVDISLLGNIGSFCLYIVSP